MKPGFGNIETTFRSSYWIPLSAVVEDAAPTKIVMTSSIVNTTLQASDFTIAGRIITLLERDITNTILTLTLSTSIISGDVLSVVIKTQAPVVITNNVADVGFITEWLASGNATQRTITLPLINTRLEGALAYNCTVDWGGWVSSFNDHYV